MSESGVDRGSLIKKLDLVIQKREDLIRTFFDDLPEWRTQPPPVPLSGEMARKQDRADKDSVSKRIDRNRVFFSALYSVVSALPLGNLLLADECLFAREWAQMIGYKSDQLHVVNTFRESGDADVAKFVRADREKETRFQGVFLDCCGDLERHQADLISPFRYRALKDFSVFVCTVSINEANHKARARTLIEREALKNGYVAAFMRERRFANMLMLCFMVNTKSRPIRGQAR